MPRGLMGSVVHFPEIRPHGGEGKSRPWQRSKGEGLGEDLKALGLVGGKCIYWKGSQERQPGRVYRVSKGAQKFLEDSLGSEERPCPRGLWKEILGPEALLRKPPQAKGKPSAQGPRERATVPEERGFPPDTQGRKDSWERKGFLHQQARAAEAHGQGAFQAKVRVQGPRSRQERETRS